MQRVVALRHAADRDQVIRRLQEELGRSREELSRAAVRVREATARGGRIKPEPSIPLRSTYPNRNPARPTSQCQPKQQQQHQHQPDAAGGRGAERARTYSDMA